MTPLGVVFTPIPWVRWALERLDAPAQIAAGASFCDPTAGEGAFAWALAEIWAGSSGTVDRGWVKRITLVERDGKFLETFARRWHERWGFSFPEKNLYERDVITDPPDTPFDLIAGNPPWITYPDLGVEDQDRYRPWFRNLDLVGGPSELLLGRSRLDLAALITARVFTTMMHHKSRAGFFLPLSLFHSEGTAARWRRWRPDSVFDLTDARPFQGVTTRCGWAEFTPHSPPVEGVPIPYYWGTPGAWDRCDAVAEGGTAWRLVPQGTVAILPSCTLQPWQRPRQGINTGGANAAFHVASRPAGVDFAVVHPLVDFSAKTENGRWILVPYHRHGAIFDESDLTDAGLTQYWLKWRERLAQRKGILLGSQLKKGRWWALLGVGAYAFAPYKVVWSAYGKDRLDAQVYGPRDDGSVWQANQALQAYIPCLTEADAQRIAGFLNSLEVGGYLISLRGAGTKNWAQPGRFKPLWHWSVETLDRD